MQRQQRVRVLWIALIGAIVLSAVIIPLWVTADSGQPIFTATLYSDVIRFEAEGVASLRVTIYDLSENELWNSGLIMGDFVDWDRANARGERLANGYYMYLAQGWDAGDRLILNKAGKVVLLPGDQVELKAAPGTSSALDEVLPWEEDGPVYGPKSDATNWCISGMLGIGTDTPAYSFDLIKTLTGTGTVFGGRISSTFNPSASASTLAGLAISANTAGSNSIYSLFGGFLNVEHYGTGTVTSATGFQGKVNNRSSGTLTTARGLYSAVQNVGSGVISNGYGLFVQSPLNSGGGTFTNFYGVYVQNPTAASNNWAIYAAGGKSYFADNVGIGTTNATDKLTVEGATGNLIACYPSAARGGTSAVFRVEADGDVYADGTVYSDKWAVGSADVAERINTSEWVEAGDVIEIDPDHTGFFRKASGVYSRRVAGIISTSPGVILGNDFDPETDKWDDNRPVLAIAGRVPVKASTENGPIAVGDLLVSSSDPGVAMKGDPAAAIGAVVGKAMEPLQEGEGTIMAQVTLR